MEKAAHRAVACLRRGPPALHSSVIVLSSLLACNPEMRDAPPDRRSDVLIVGAGIVGLAHALVAARRVNWAWSGAPAVPGRRERGVAAMKDRPRCRALG